MPEPLSPPTHRPNDSQPDERASQSSSDESSQRRARVALTLALVQWGANALGLVWVWALSRSGLPGHEGVWFAASLLLPLIATAVVTVAVERARRAMREERERVIERLGTSNRELARTRDEARDAASARGHLLARVSHEIRTPMNAVVGMAELLLDTPLDETQHAYASTVRSSSERLLALEIGRAHV